MYGFALEKRWFWDGNEDRQFGQVGVWTLDPPPLGQRKCMVLHRKSNGFGMANEDRQFGQVGVWTLDPPPLGQRKCMVLHKKSNGFGMASEDRQFGQVGVWTSDPPPLGCMVLQRKSNGGRRVVVGSGRSYTKTKTQPFRGWEKGNPIYQQKY